MISLPLVDWTFCVMETWQTVGESSAFSELLLSNYTYLNSPRTTGQGGGIATLYKENFFCKQFQNQVGLPSPGSLCCDISSSEM